MSRSEVGSLRRAAAVAALLLSVAAALWLALGHYHLQLGLEGTTVLTFRLPEAAGAGDESPRARQVRQAARVHIERGLSDEVAILPVGLSFSQDLARLELHAADEKDVSRFLRGIGPADLRLLPVRTEPQPLTASDRLTLDAQLARRGPAPPGTRVLVQVQGDQVQGERTSEAYYTALVVEERPLVTSDDVDDAIVKDDFDGRPALHVKLKPEAGTRLEAYTADHLGDRIAMVIDGEVLMAPTIQMKIGSEFLISNVKRDEAARLAERLRSSGRPPLVLLQRSLVGSHASRVRGLAAVLGALAVAAWLFAIAARQRVWAVALAAGVTALAVGLAADVLFGGLLMVSYAPTLGALAIVAAVTAVLSQRRGGPSEGLRDRLATSWPGLALLAAAPLAGILVATRVTGSIKGTAMAAFFAGWPVLIATGLAVIAVASRSDHEGN
jgi:hypothetical protein